MFIRIKTNKGGSKSVMLLMGERVPGKKHPVLRIIKNFGRASDEANLELLKKEAAAYKAQLNHVGNQAKALKISKSTDISSCRSYCAGFVDVYGQAFDSFLGHLNLSIPCLKRLRDIVTMRIAEPASKLKTAALARHHNLECKVNNTYRLMDQLNASMIESIKQAVYNNTQRLLAEQKMSVNVLFYDLTTIYFETNTQDEIRDFGFSKDGKHMHVQIMLAVIVTEAGLPVDYVEFKGNCYEGHTLIPVIESLSAKYDISTAVLVADAALMNKVNLRELDARGIKYVISAKIKCASVRMQKAIFEQDGYKIVKRVSAGDTDSEDCVSAKVIESKRIQQPGKKTEKQEIKDRVIVYHSTCRARKDAHDRQQDLARIQKYVDSTAKSKLTGSLRKPYVKISKGCKIAIDLEKLESAQRFDGFFGLRTNIVDPNPAELLSTYRGLWQVEQTFRIAKNSLDIRPVFHYTPRRIRAHFAICYIALALMRHVHFTLKSAAIDITYEQLQMALSNLNKVIIKDHNNQAFELLQDPPPELLLIYQTLKLRWPKKFQYINHM